ncbi:MAG: F0F1 ATP synthase subunit B [Candidatus Doudnabacteria bacterium]|nr:F0F1 ATP synthase subunit B [Candidatus Doudnabacteria bacterium]
MNLLDIIIPIAHAAEEPAVKEGGVAVLGINLKLFIAQLVNFAVVLGILWKFVFTPVAKQLQARTEKIEKAMADATTTEKEKQEFAVWKQQEIAKVKTEAGSIISSAQADAGKVKEDLLKQAKEEQQKLIEQGKKQIEQEKAQALQAAKSELADIITTATEKILREKLTGDKDQKLIKDSLKDIK